MAFFILFLSAFSLFYLLATMFLHRGLKRLSFPASEADNGLSFSVIIAAHNEESHIASCLESVLSQTIANERYEVIVVDDRSTDATSRIVDDVARRHSNLRLIAVRKTPAGISPKKHAVTLGIAQAKNQVIVFTDADCRVPATWLFSVSRHFGADVGLVQGITTYHRTATLNGFFYGIQAVDFLSHGIVAAAAIGSRFPLNSNANNLAFKKAAFDDIGGYGAAGRVVSGDDDMLLQKIWKSDKWKIRYMTDPAGAVETEPAPSVRAMFEQRKRWGSKTVHYSARQALFLGGIFLFYLSIFAAAAVAFFYPVLWLAAAGLLAIKFIGELLLLIPGTRIFKKTELRKFIAPASIVQLPLVIGAVVFGVFGKFKWKGQRFGRTMPAKKAEDTSYPRKHARKD